MAATKEDIRAWLDRGKEKGNSHMIVACDTFDRHDYHVYVDGSEDVKERVEETRSLEMTRVMEVYSYSMDLEQQLNEERAYNLEIKVTPKSSLETYIGTKIIQAEPLSCQKAIHKSSFGDPGYKVVYEDGYISWSPKDVFENAYRKTDGMSFGLAVEALRKGLKVCFKGWPEDKLLFLSQVGLGSEARLPTNYITNRIYISDRVICCLWYPEQSEILQDKWQIWEET